MNLKMHRQNKNEAGIALILAAVALMAIGSFLIFGFGFIQGKDKDDSNLMTRQKMERIMTQLASFAQLYNRLPCAATTGGGVTRNVADFGGESRAGAGESCASLEGIVPFRALGIQERDVKDAWGRYITYRVSRVFTELDDINSTGVNIGERCRIEGVWVSTALLTNQAGTIDFNFRNVNPSKAKFCCPGVAAPFFAETTDISISKAGAPLVIRPDNGATARSDSTTDFYTDLMDDPLPIAADQPDPDANHEAVAVVLVSHGLNGTGAFLPNGSGARLAGTEGTSEDENNDADIAYADIALTYGAGTGYFDDIIIYRTQYQLYSMLNGTCLRPYR